MNETSNLNLQQLFRSCDSSKVIQKVEVSQAQRQDLLRRINVFDDYYANLPQDKKDEVDLDKSCSLDTHWTTARGGVESGVKKGIKSHIDAQNVVNQFRNNPDMELTNQDVSYILKYTDTTDTEIDGKIGSFNQGYNGSCWYLAMLNNYASTPEGAQNIANRIKENEDGSVTITFQDPTNPTQTKEYTVTKQELELNPYLTSRDQTETWYMGMSNFASGDKDVRAFEIATSKLLLDFMPEDEVKEHEDRDQQIISGGALSKRAIVHKAMGYESDLVTYEAINKVENYFMEKHAPEVYQANPDTKIFKLTLGTKTNEETGRIELVPDAQPTEYKDLASVLNSPDFEKQNATTGSFIKYLAEPCENNAEGLYVQNGHAYNIDEVQPDGDVVLQDSYATQFLRPFSINVFTDPEKIWGLQTYKEAPKKAE